VAKVTIVNYGIGNMGSICNMYRKLRVDAEIATTAKAVTGAERLILPGIGAFDACIKALNASGLRDSVLEFAASQRPMLGICVGMQMLTHGSEEGLMPGLGLIDAKTVRFPEEPGLRIPHMGWNVIEWTLPSHPLVQGLTDESRFYFVHSYRVHCASATNSLGTCNYGGPFSAAVIRDNLMGAQFHPEKSHRFGLRFLGNFASL
jgi:glutamine amidotransferase